MSDTTPPAARRGDRHTRSTTGVRFPTELYEQLTAAATERDVSVNWLVNRAVADFLERLLPVDEVRWTRDPARD